MRCLGNTQNGVLTILRRKILARRREGAKLRGNPE
jgi:hypothetical protein